jgi:hypothetical protein
MFFDIEDDDKFLIFMYGVLVGCFAAIGLLGLFISLLI